jgi:hypothetical protein
MSHEWKICIQPIEVEWERKINYIGIHINRENQDYLHFYVKITICTHEEKTNNASYIGSHIR